VSRKCAHVSQRRLLWRVHYAERGRDWAYAPVRGAPPACLPLNDNLGGMSRRVEGASVASNQSTEPITDEDDFGRLERMRRVSVNCAKAVLGVTGGDISPCAPHQIG
jgi:hypothetical protein